MSTTGHEWYNSNELRAYPVDETTTKLSDDGTLLPDDILVDAQIQFPRSLGDFAMLSSVTVSSGLVTLTFVACPEHALDDPDPTTFTPLGAIALTSVTPHKPYQLESFSPGVDGWIVLGNWFRDTADEINLRFTRCNQAMLSPRAAQAYEESSTHSIGKFGGETDLTGIVDLVASPPLVLESAVRHIDGEDRVVVLVRLDPAGNDQLWLDYAGPCAGRVENNGCLRTPIRTISGVEPDCNGNIEILVQQSDLTTTATVDVYDIPFDENGNPAGTKVLEYALGMEDICPVTETELPYERSLESLPGPSVPEEPEPVELDSSSSSSSSGLCPPLPDDYCELFTNPDLVACYWDPVTGEWTILAEAMAVSSSSSSSSLEVELVVPESSSSSSFAPAFFCPIGFPAGGPQRTFEPDGMFNDYPIYMAYDPEGNWYLWRFNNLWAMSRSPGSQVAYYRIGDVLEGDYKDVDTGLVAGYLSDGICGPLSSSSSSLSSEFIPPPSSSSSLVEVSSSSPSSESGEPGELKNVIVLVAAGADLTHFNAGSIFAYGTGGMFNFQGFPYSADIDTHDAASQTPDSASAATALAAGRLVNPGVISQNTPGDGADLTTIAGVWKSLGRKTGLVTNSFLTDATVAAFGAHNASRANYSAISDEYRTSTKPDVLLGGGGSAFGITPADYTGSGWGVMETKFQLDAVARGAYANLAGIFGTGYFPYEFDGVGSWMPHLSDMTSNALRLLENDEGFLLVVENEMINQASKVNHDERMLYDMIEFANSVQEAITWAAGRNDTLILVLGDHSRGNLSIGDSHDQNVADLDWGGTAITSANTKLYATGVLSERFCGLMHLTQVWDALTDVGWSSSCRVEVEESSMSGAEHYMQLCWRKDEGDAENPPVSRGCGVDPIYGSIGRAFLVEDVDGVYRESRRLFTRQDISANPPATGCVDGSIALNRSSSSSSGTAEFEDLKLFGELEGGVAWLDRDCTLGSSSSSSSDNPDTEFTEFNRIGDYFLYVEDSRGFDTPEGGVPLVEISPTQLVGAYEADHPTLDCVYTVSVEVGMVADMWYILTRTEGGDCCPPPDGEFVYDTPDPESSSAAPAPELGGMFTPLSEYGPPFVLEINSQAPLFNGGGGTPGRVILNRYSAGQPDVYAGSYVGQPYFGHYSLAYDVQLGCFADFIGPYGSPLDPHSLPGACSGLWPYSCPGYIETGNECYDEDEPTIKTQYYERGPLVSARIFSIDLGDDDEQWVLTLTTDGWNSDTVDSPLGAPAKAPITQTFYGEGTPIFSGGPPRSFVSTTGTVTLVPGEDPDWEGWDFGVSPYDGTRSPEVLNWVGAKRSDVSGATFGALVFVGDREYQENRWEWTNDPAATPFMVPDSSAAGVRLRIEPNGAKLWEFKFSGETYWLAYPEYGHSPEGTYERSTGGQWARVTHNLFGTADIASQRGAPYAVRLELLETLHHPTLPCFQTPLSLSSISVRNTLNASYSISDADFAGGKDPDCPGGNASCILAERISWGVDPLTWKWTPTRSACWSNFGGACPGDPGYFLTCTPSGTLLTSCPTGCSNIALGSPVGGVFDCYDCVTPNSRSYYHMDGADQTWQGAPDPEYIFNDAGGPIKGESGSSENPEVPESGFPGDVPFPPPPINYDQVRVVLEDTGVIDTPSAQGGVLMAQISELFWKGTYQVAISGCGNYTVTLVLFRNGTEWSVCAEMTAFGCDPHALLSPPVVQILGTVVDTHGTQLSYIGDGRWRGYRRVSDCCAYQVDIFKEGSLWIVQLDTPTEDCWPRTPQWSSPDSATYPPASQCARPELAPLYAGAGAVKVLNECLIETSSSSSSSLVCTRGIDQISGLRGEYYQGQAFETLKNVRYDLNVNFDWGGGYPAAGVSSEDFSVRWSGYLLAPEDGLYTFFLTSDGGARLFVNGHTLVDNWTAHPAVEDVGASRYLYGGKQYPIVVEYRDTFGVALVNLKWSSDTIEKSVISDCHLSTAPLYFNGSTWFPHRYHVQDDGDLTLYGKYEAHYEVAPGNGPTDLFPEDTVEREVVLNPIGSGLPGWQSDWYALTEPDVLGQHYERRDRVLLDDEAGPSGSWPTMAQAWPAKEWVWYRDVRLMDGVTVVSLLVDSEECGSMNLRAAPVMPLGAFQYRHEIEGGVGGNYVYEKIEVILPGSPSVSSSSENQFPGEVSEAFDTNASSDLVPYMKGQPYSIYAYPEIADFHSAYDEDRTDYVKAKFNRFYVKSDGDGVWGHNLGIIWWQDDLERFGETDPDFYVDSRSFYIYRLGDFTNTSWIAGVERVTIQQPVGSTIVVSRGTTIYETRDPLIDAFEDQLGLWKALYPQGTSGPRTYQTKALLDTSGTPSDGNPIPAEEDVCKPENDMPDTFTLIATDIDEDSTRDSGACLARVAESSSLSSSESGEYGGTIRWEGTWFNHNILSDCWYEVRAELDFSGTGWELRLYSDSTCGGSPTLSQTFTAPYTGYCQGPPAGSWSLGAEITLNHGATHLLWLERPEAYNELTLTVEGTLIGSLLPVAGPPMAWEGTDDEGNTYRVSRNDEDPWWKASFIDVVTGEEVGWISELDCLPPPGGTLDGTWTPVFDFCMMDMTLELTGSSSSSG